MGSMGSVRLDPIMEAVTYVRAPRKSSDPSAEIPLGNPEREILELDLEAVEFARSCGVAGINVADCCVGGAVFTPAQEIGHGFEFTFSHNLNGAARHVADPARQFQVIRLVFG